MSGIICHNNDIKFVFLCSSFPAVTTSQHHQAPTTPLKKLENEKYLYHKVGIKFQQWNDSTFQHGLASRTGQERTWKDPNLLSTNLITLFEVKSHFFSGDLG